MQGRKATDLMERWPGYLGEVREGGFMKKHFAGLVMGLIIIGRGG